jgi:DNA repair protein RecO
LIWQDHGFLLHYSPFGERSFIVTVLTQDHGKVRAWVRSNKPALVLGSAYDVLWKSRIEDNLGSFSLDSSGAAVWLMMHHQGALRALNLMCYMCKQVLPERVPFPRLYTLFGQTIEQLATPNGLKAYDDFECLVLDELGYASAEYGQSDCTTTPSICGRLLNRQRDYATHWPDLHRLHRMRSHFIQDVLDVLSHSAPPSV